MISVVIPAFNEEACLPRCLDSLRRQDYKDYEMIVVASGNDNTAEIASEFGAILVQSDRKGIAAARQCGFAVAKGEVIASTDADTIVPPNWLGRVDELFQEHPRIIAVAGHFALYDGPLAVRMVTKLSLLLMPVITRTAPWIWNFGGFNFAVKADAFCRSGGFNVDLEFGEDVDLCRRLKSMGAVHFDSNLIVQTSGRAFLKDRLGLRNLANYLSVLLRGRPSLEVIHGCDVAQPDRRQSTFGPVVHHKGVSLDRR